MKAISWSTEVSITSELVSHTTTNWGTRLFIKRDDLIDREVSGNKWRKLKYNLLQFVNSRSESVLTFGGAFSNHLLATAKVCSEAGVHAIGLVRGEELNSSSNEILRRCSELGMQLEFITREEYSYRHEKMYWEELTLRYPNVYIIPEGGANYYGMIGCQEILKETNCTPDHIFIAQGTTATSCGIMLSLKPHQQLHVVPVLKGFDSIGEMKELLKYTGIDNELTEDILKRVMVHDEYHYGGYGKTTPDLLTKIQDWMNEFDIPLDPVYTGKAFSAMMDKLVSGQFKNSTVLFVHTGGTYLYS